MNGFLSHRGDVDIDGGSWESNIDLLKEVERTRERIRENGDLPYASADEQLAFLDRMVDDPLGRYFLVHGGANGSWTHYLLVESRRDGHKPSDYEKDLFRMPLVHATRVRFDMFREELQKLVRPGVRMASLPCGVMADLIDLDYREVDEFQLTGIDLDRNSLNKAAAYAENAGLSDRVRFVQKDAWDVSEEHEFDVLTSNGLNIYVPDPDRLNQLYAGFYRMLAPGGSLIMSYIAPPPGVMSPEDAGEWDSAAIDAESMRLQRIMMKDLMRPTFLNYTRRSDLEAVLTDLGFTIDKIRPGFAGAFPTVVASKN